MLILLQSANVTPVPATARYGDICRLYCWLQRKKPRSWIRKTKHQATAGLGRVIDGMIFGLVSFFASVVYWLHDVHPCIHIGLLRLWPAGLCTGLHSCWGQYLISLGSNMVRIQRVSLVLRKSSGWWTPTLYCRSAPGDNSIDKLNLPYLDQ